MQEQATEEKVGTTDRYDLTQMSWINVKKIIIIHFDPNNFIEYFVNSHLFSRALRKAFSIKRDANKDFIRCRVRRKRRRRMAPPP